MCGARLVARVARASLLAPSSPAPSSFPRSSERFSDALFHLSSVSHVPRRRDGCMGFVSTRETRCQNCCCSIGFRVPRRPSAALVSARSTARMPARAPAAGEQYRFHFDMGKCIGCKCCVVACNEQNGNPASINWRRVGEIEGGWFPARARAPTSRWAAITASSPPASRAARSTPTRRTRSPASCGTAPMPASAASTARGTAPTACRSTTPSAAWSASATCATAAWRSGRRRRASARARRARSRSRSSTSPSGAPSVAASAATPGLPGRRRQPVDDARDAAGDAAAQRAPARHHARHARAPALAARGDDGADAAVGRRVRDHLAAAAARARSSGSASRRSRRCSSAAWRWPRPRLHLGRPIHAYRAMRMWRRSWLSREVLLFSAFSTVAARLCRRCCGSAAGRRWSSARCTVAARPRRRDRQRLHLPRAVAAGVEHAATRCCSSSSPPACSGRSSPRPSASATRGGSRSAPRRWPARSCVLLALRFFRCIASDSLELRGTARLLSTVLAAALVARGVLLALGAHRAAAGRRRAGTRGRRRLAACSLRRCCSRSARRDPRPLSVLRQRRAEAHGRAVLASASEAA